MTKTTVRPSAGRFSIRTALPFLAAALFAAGCGEAGEGGDVPPGSDPTSSDVALTPKTSLDASGPAGGPFAPASKSYKLTNSGTGTTDWSAVVSAGDNWVSLSQSSGQLGAGEQVDVIVSITQGLAAALSPGNHPAQVVFLDDGNGGELIGAVDVNLSVQAAAVGAILAVTPSVGFSAAGTVGGPFAPGNVAYVLENEGDQPLTWSSSANQNWITLSNAGGQLAPGAQVSVQVGIQQGNAGNLAAGDYQASVEFENDTNDVGSTSFGVSLSVAAAPIPGSLSVTPGIGITAGGPVGGPFGHAVQSYTLANFGASPISFTVSKTQPWVTLSASSGTLAPSGVNVITVSINQGVAANLAAGVYGDTVSFTNTTNGTGNTSVPVALTVEETETPGQLVVNPTTPFAPGGPEGGPFTPSSTVYGLSNPGGQAFNWAVSVNQSWLTVSGPSTGQLAAGGSGSVTIGLVSGAAQNLSPGTYNGKISFTNFSTGAVVTEIAASLSVASPSTPGDGWTEFEPSTDSRVIYVSNSLGNDSFNGLSEGAPKKTIAAGIAELRHGFPDWLLFKKGDSWSGGLGNWKKSGRSASEPMLISSYGTGARPRFNTTGGNGVGSSPGGGSPPELMHIAFVGLELAGNNTGGEGAAFLLKSTDVLFEDMVFRNFAGGVVLQGYSGRHTNMRLRRSHIWDNYKSGISNGIYAWSVDGLLIEECVFDTNGWFPGQDPADIFSHNMYLDNGCTNVRTLNNIVVNGASHGIQQRSGGEIRGNLMLRNAIAIVGGEGNYPEIGGVDCYVTDNVIMDGRDIDANNPRGWGIVLSNVKQGEIRDNLIAKNQDGHFPLSLNLRGDYFAPDNSYQTVGVHNVPIEDNVIFDWGAIHIEGDATQQLSNLDFKRNDIQDHVGNGKLINHYYPQSIGAFDSANNRLFSLNAPSGAWMAVGASNKSATQWKQEIGDTTSSVQNVAYSGANRTVGTWNALQGFGNSHNAFMQEVRKQSKDFWRPEYTALVVNQYLRDGFDM